MNDSRINVAAQWVWYALRALHELYDDLDIDDCEREVLRRSLRELGRTQRRLKGMAP